MANKKINIRTKGAKGEREVIKLLQPVVTEVFSRAGLEVPKLQRNSLQSDGGGYDVLGVEFLALEVKRCETLKINAWWEQTRRQTRAGQIPVLMYRQSRKPWSVVMQVTLANRVCRGTIEMPDFINWLRRKLELQLKLIDRM